MKGESFGFAKQGDVTSSSEAYRDVGASPRNAMSRFPFQVLASLRAFHFNRSRKQPHITPSELIPKGWSYYRNLFWEYVNSVGVTCICKFAQ